MNRWFLFNFGLLCLALWNIVRKNFFIHWQIPLLLGFIGLLFILFNWTRHAMYSTIRETPDRQRKIKYAKLSKKAIRIHKWTGSTALLFAIAHGISSWQTYKFTTYEIKMIFGLLALLTLLSVVIAGWLRHFWPTIRKRYWHLYLAMTMIFLVLIHIFIQN
ncbi:MAG TPA: hypothetical protein VK056_02700 [Bacillota bacterium]|nr:hypothetical protein [Bacillota bacterium]